MYLYIKYLVVTAAALLLVCIIVRALRISHAVKLQRLLSNDAAGCCFSSGFVGCSILCRDIKHIEELQTLLCSEYDRYEVLLVLDADLQPELFHEIVKRFSMVRVTPPTHTELSAGQIRLLYRSRQRCFRRLILIDKGRTSPHDDLNAAIAIASFDYLLPLAGSAILHHDAIENIAIMLSSSDNADIADIDLIYSVSDGSLIFRRDAVIEAGGFSCDIPRTLPRKRTRAIHLPLIKHTSSPNSRTLIMIFTAIAALVIALCFIDFTMAMIVVSTLLVIVCSSHYMAHLLEGRCSLRTIFCQIRHLWLFFLSSKVLFLKKICYLYDEYKNAANNDD